MWWVWGWVCTPGKYLRHPANVLCADGSDAGKETATTQMQGHVGYIQLRRKNAGGRRQAHQQIDNDSSEPTHGSPTRAQLQARTNVRNTNPCRHHYYELCSEERPLLRAVNQLNDVRI